jgi:site-specific DNA-methyltransferase (adenine-specific)
MTLDEIIEQVGIEPYHREEAGVIYCGDCRDILPLMPKVDLVLTDPPYEKEAHTAKRRTRATFEKRKTIDSIPFEAISEVLRETVCAVSCNWSLVFCQAEAVAEYQRVYGDAYRRPMVWIKPDSSPQFSGDRPAMGYESIVCAWLGKGKSRWNGGGKRGVYTFNVTHGRKSNHPTEKPLKLINQLLTDFSLGGVILDPFLGSGTTAVAAKELGLKFIGIEISEEYCAIAVKRLKQGVLDFG